MKNKREKNFKMMQKRMRKMMKMKKIWIMTK